MHQTYGNTSLARTVWRLTLVLDGLLVFGSLCGVVATNNPAVFLLWLVIVGITPAAGVYAYRQGLLFEWRIARRFTKICQGLGGKFQGEGVSIARSIREGIQSRGRYDVPTQTKLIYPKLRHVRGNREAWTGVINPLAGQTVEDYNNHAEAFTLAFDVPFVTFEKTDSSFILIRCGPVQVPELHEYEPAAGSVITNVGLDAVPMARTLDGEPWFMPIEGNHLLIAGRTGAGKGSWIWSLVFGLAEARANNIVKLWGIDPKRVELAYGRDWWDEYADTSTGIVELLEKAVAELLDRNAQIQGKARKFTPSPATPLNVIIIDELAYVSALVPDKKTRDRMEAAIATILVLGRATGYSLVGASQDPRKSVLNFRDLFPTRVALGMEAPMVDLVLGDGMHDAGAYCEQIPLREAGAGCAYVKDDFSSKPLLVRAAWCSDEFIRSHMATWNTN